ncbi:MAG: hypothetical protein WDA75_15930 [Candidatus Latescibacterota bacterium]|jgi:hypothetical protein
MVHARSLWAGTAILAFVLPAGLLLAETPATAPAKVSAQLFGDYYWVAAADPAAVQMRERQNALQFRRVYLTADREMSAGISARLRLEANDPGFGKNDRLNVYVKNAYARWRNAPGGAELYAGLTATPTWAVSEEYWGYRWVEKTVMDLEGVGSSADMGVALKGRRGSTGYFLMASHGAGVKSEGDHGKKLAASLSRPVSPGLIVEGYADLNQRPAGQDEITAKGFVGVKKDAAQGGLEAFVRWNRKAAAGSGDDVRIVGASAFGSAPVRPRTRLVARLDAVHRDDLDATDLLVIGGVDLTLAPELHLMPNLYAEIPDGADPTVQVRLTFDAVF